MKLQTLISFSVLIAAFFVSCKKENAVQENLSTIMLTEVNKIRSSGCQCGDEWMPPVRQLKWNTLLEQAALAHAKDMYENHYFDHFGLDSSFPIQRAVRFGYTGTAVGENIARGFDNTIEVMEAWKKSIEHCKNMMDSSYSELGAAAYNQYWAQEFGSTDVFSKPAYKIQQTSFTSSPREEPRQSLVRRTVIRHTTCK